MKTLFTTTILALLMLGCAKDFSGQWPYQPPVDLSDGLRVGTLEEANIDPAMVAKAVGRIQTGKYKEVHAMLIYKDGSLVFEEYYPGHKYKWDGPGHHGEWVDWEPAMQHNIMSVTKSITSLCIGIAIEQGIIENVQQSIFDFLPDHRHLMMGGKESITIEHLLTMTAGLRWPEWTAPYSSLENPAIGIFFSDKDPISFILEVPLENEPGTTFNYSTGNMILLGEILHNASGMNIATFSETFLFGPLGIEHYSWYLQFPNGVYANNLELTPRGMAKIGAVFANSGKWQNQQIIPLSWIEKNRTVYPGNERINVPGEASGKMGYTYGWWTKTFTISGRKTDLVAASGFGGQHIMVLPELHAVVVFTGGNYLTRRPPFEILERFILPAMR